MEAQCKLETLNCLRHGHLPRWTHSSQNRRLRRCFRATFMPDVVSSDGPTPSCESESLGDDLRAGSKVAFEAVVRQFGGRMLAVARQILGNEIDAQDAVQDAFLVAFRSLERFEGRSSIATWLHRIVVNAALMKLRSGRRKREQPIEELLPVYLSDGHQARPAARWSESSLATIEREETCQAVRRCIDELPETHRYVLILRDIQELDTQTVAEMLEISTDAVKVRLHRARQALRTLLDSVFGESH
jgi:RNA polymerase sigma-70 factor (ECF subfamily)